MSIRALGAAGRRTTVSFAALGVWAAAVGSAAVLPAPLRDRAAHLRDAALQGTQAFAIVRSLTTEVGPRPAGSAADKAAVVWGLRTLGEAGLQNVHREKVMVSAWERGMAGGEILSPFHQTVALAALGGSVGSAESGVEAEVVMVDSLAALGKVDDAQARGRIVFFNTKMERTRDGAGYGTAVKVRGDGASAAAAKGAIAVLIRSIGTDSNRLPHTGAMRYAEGVRRIPAAALSIPDADLLAEEMRSGQPVRFRLRLTARQLPEEESANVVGEVPGRERPAEVVLLGCHLDSWDLGTGALDDGAGCAIVIEAARRIAQAGGARRTIRVVLFANEEHGLDGAKAYAAAHAAEASNMVAALEADLGSGAVWRFDSAVPPAGLAAVAEITELLKPLGVQGGANDSEGGADISQLHALGVPLLAPSQDASQYFDFHHTANDTFDKVDAKGLDQNVAVYAVAAYCAAEMPGDFK